MVQHTLMLAGVDPVMIAWAFRIGSARAAQFRPIVTVKAARRKADGNNEAVDTQITELTAGDGGGVEQPSTCVSSSGRFVPPDALVVGETLLNADVNFATFGAFSRRTQAAGVRFEAVIQERLNVLSREGFQRG
ncbi:hypothetical protein ACQ856_29975 (plasmid) [Mycolicibacterium psychrotolerans]|uniref:hypothetical protein n=1 Tax=Mycolicibacterium psychrotolerans TaxID=216929 RepID=UPI003D66A155